jgi:hypothetical protein
MYIACIRSNQHILVREDGKVHLETTFVSSLFKGLSKRDAAIVEDDKFLIEGSKQMLTYDMVTQLHLFIIIKIQSMFSIDNAEVNCVKLIICVFLPINICNEHWYLAIINSMKRKIKILDSLCWTYRHEDVHLTVSCFILKKKHNLT